MIKIFLGNTSSKKSSLTVQISLPLRNYIREKQPTKNRHRMTNSLKSLAFISCQSLPKNDLKVIIFFFYCRTYQDELVEILYSICLALWQVMILKPTCLQILAIYYKAKTLWLPSVWTGSDVIMCLGGHEIMWLILLVDAHRLEFIFLDGNSLELYYVL